MKIIRNSHSGVGGIAAENYAMVKYVAGSNHRPSPSHSLALIHRDPNHNTYLKHCSANGNISVHYMIIRSLDEIFDKGDTIQDFKKKNAHRVSRISRIIQEEKPDIALCAGSFYYPWFILKAAEKHKLPIVVRYAGIIEKEETEKIWHDLGREFINPSYYYLFPSHHAKNTLEKIHNIRLPNSRVIYNGLNSVFFRNKKHPRALDGSFTIAYVGRLAQVKNPLYCVKLMDALRKTNTCANFICVIDDCHLKSPLPKTKRVIDKLEGAGIKLLPSMSQAKLADLYKSVNLLIIPSFFETFGNVPVEAVATGTPALINKTVGAKEVFAELGLDDLVVDFNDLDAVVRKIAQIKKERWVISRDITEHLAENYSWEKIISTYMKILRDFLKEKKKNQQ